MLLGGACPAHLFGGITMHYVLLAIAHLFLAVVFSTIHEPVLAATQAICAVLIGGLAVVRANI